MLPFLLLGGSCIVARKWVGSWWRVQQNNERVIAREDSIANG